MAFGTIEKRKAHIAQIHRRQITECTTQCASMERVLACSTASCVCPIVNAAGSAAATVCASCLKTSAPSFASIVVTLVDGICSKCESQCSATLTAYIQSQSCNSTTCACSLFSSVGLPAITACANCVQSFNPLPALGVLQFVEQCGIGTANASISSISASSSASAASNTNVTTSSQVGTTSTGAASSPLSTVSMSVGRRICTDLFTNLFWMMFLGALVFNFS